MSFVTVIIILLLTYLVYRRTRSILWAALALVAAIIFIPMVMDQVSALWGGGAPVATSNQGGSQSSGSCNCN